jgi:tetrahydromethanopterin S-methyltransferase, subunit H (EC 2.1.1.86)
MFKYKTSQKVYEIDGLKIGGNSFEIPPVLMASIFYHGHKVFINEQKGLFNRDTALQLIDL